MVDKWEKDLQKELENPEFAGSYGAECARSAFGLALLHARQKKKLTQQQLSAILGIRQPYIAQLESGEANPTLSTAGRIMASLGFRIVISTAPLNKDTTLAGSDIETKQLSLAAEKRLKYSSR